MSVSISPLFRSKQNKRVEVSSFDNKIDAMEYYHKLLEGLEESDEFRTLKSYVYASHYYNAMNIQDTTSLTAYYGFFKEQYVDVDSDILRSDFDITNLYTNKDTASFYVCFKTTRDLITEREEIRKSIQDYNTLHFSHLHLYVRDHPINKYGNLMLYNVGMFRDELAAIEYYNHLTEMSTEFGNDYDMKNDLFIISFTNYFRMLREESIDDYMNFYVKEYEEKLDL